MGRQAVEQFQLFGRGLHHFALDLELVAVHIQAEVVELHHPFGGFFGRGRPAGAPAQHRLDAGHHFLAVKRLDDVVVAQHLVEGLALGGQHDDGGVPLLADAAADLPAVQPGHHHIQQDHVRLDLPILGQGVLPVRSQGDLVPLLGQVEPQQLADILVVVHDEDLFVSHDVLLTALGRGRADLPPPLRVAQCDTLLIIRERYDKIKNIPHKSEGFSP